MTLVLFFILLVHGLIHVIGFVHAFRPGEDADRSITKPKGIFWLATCGVLSASAVLYILHVDAWWIITLIGLLLSQAMIFTAWKTSKAGTLINILLLFVVLFAAADYNFKSHFRNDAELLIGNQPQTSPLTQSDIDSLPMPVQRYIQYCGCIGKPKVFNFKVAFTGQLRQNDSSARIPFTSTQYNFLNPATRLFFMRAKMNNLPVAGYHRYTSGVASMDFRLFSFFTVQQQSGEQMNRAETVTFFNDMCVLAPATLIDKRIKWNYTDGDTVRAEFSTDGIKISALLVFNMQGQLINFISTDRAAMQNDGTMLLVPWSTPMKDYKQFDEVRLASSAQTVYQYPEGEFCYGEFTLTSVEYNCSSFKY